MPAKARTGEPSEGATLDLQRIQDASMSIPIIGLTPVIPHCWAEKSLKLMRDKQFSGAGAARAKREPKNPEEEAENASYWLPDGRPGMPATAFKSAIVESARYFEGVTIVMLKRIIFVEGEGPQMLVPIEGERTLREDTPRNSGGTVDLRYRYQWSDWSAILSVRFVPKLVTLESVVALVDAAGRGGVGDWRPGSPKSNTGIFGTFRIDDSSMS